LTHSRRNRDAPIFTGGFLPFNGSVDREGSGSASSVPELRIPGDNGIPCCVTDDAKAFVETNQPIRLRPLLVPTAARVWILDPSEATEDDLSGD
jgi:hypothetical protein